MVEINASVSASVPAAGSSNGTHFHDPGSGAWGEAGHRRLAVLGAGIVGACVALHMQRQGWAVGLFDAQPPGHGTTWGNAGLISVDSCIPLATPGLLRQVPGWLLDPLGPLSLPPRHLLPSLPWLWKRVRCGRWDRMLHVSDAMRALHGPALDGYRELLGARAFGEHILTQGQWHLRLSDRNTRAEQTAALLRQRHGVKAERVASEVLRERLPGLSPRLVEGWWFPAHAHTPDPAALVKALVERFVAEGGSLLQQRAVALLQHQDAVRVVTNAGEHLVHRVVVAAGMDTLGLMRSMGISLPLQAERGYHVQLGPQRGVPLVPTVFREHGFVATPMSEGLRLAGTVEVAPQDAPFDARRTDAILRHAQTFLPGLDVSRRSVWMGSRPSTPDGLPIICEAPTMPGVVLACGHGHFGLTGAPMTGRIVAQLLGGPPSGLDIAPYRLSRFH